MMEILGHSQISVTMNTSWAGLAPAMHESAGRRTPAGTRHGNRWLCAMLVEAAGSIGRMHSRNYLAAQHARLMRS
jgi:transposase